MRRLVFTCDGCDLNEHVILPPGGDPDNMFKGWISHRLVAYENGASTDNISADLCPDCSNKLRHAINPTKWPRMDAVMQTFAKKPVA
jgi:hypothetical protein